MPDVNYNADGVHFRIVPTDETNEADKAAALALQDSLTILQSQFQTSIALAKRYRQGLINAASKLRQAEKVFRNEDGFIVHVREAVEHIIAGALDVSIEGLEELTRKEK